MSIPYKVYTHYSIQEAFCHIDELVKKASELGFEQLCITDKHSLSGCLEFMGECKKHNIKPILGCDFRLYDGNCVTLIAKNINGWYNLVKILGCSKIEKEFEYVEWKDIFDHSSNLICILGGHQSVYNVAVPDEILAIKSNFKDILMHVEDDNDIEFAKNMGWPTIKGNHVFYIEEQDLLYQKIILCSKHQCTISQFDSLLEASFFNKNPCYLLNKDEYDSNILGNLVEEYNIKQSPQMPNFPIPDDTNHDEVLLNLCRQGWIDRHMNKKIGKNKDLMKIYVDRVAEELNTFKEFNLSTYVLIIHDIANFARSNRVQVGLRGSAAGCLISYLTGISDVDPVMPDPSLPYHKDRSLLFSRFINKGRMSGDHISLPDADLDIPISFRNRLIEYVTTKYGSDCVGHIITFNRMDGKGAIKEVFRILEPTANSFDIANEITKNMVDTSKIQDILQDILEDDPNYSVIHYCIDNIPRIKEYAIEYPLEFDTAKKMANTIRNTGIHAAGIVISNASLASTFPTKINPKTGEKIVALEMADAEACGAVKYDFLGVAALEKIDTIMDMINNNLSEPIINTFGEIIDG